MPSHELLELFGVRVVEDVETMTRTLYVDLAPDGGGVAKAMRGGERGETEQMMAQCANELSVLRAGLVPNAQADQYGSRLFLTMARMREYAEERREERNVHYEPGGLYSLWQEV